MTSATRRSEPNSLTVRLMTYDGNGSEKGMLTLAEARERYEDVVYEADSNTITVGDEIAPCDHPGMERGACIECGERCTDRDTGATDDLCHDDECPIHGSAS